MTNKKQVIDMEFDGEKFKEVDIEKYSDKYSESGFFDKIKSVIKKVGAGLIYKAMQLFYVAQNPNCPKKIRMAIFATLGYFISPIDLLPDFTPIIGFTDDAGAIATALIIAQFYIDEDVKKRAKDKIRMIFGDKIVAELK